MSIHSPAIAVYHRERKVQIAGFKMTEQEFREFIQECQENLRLLELEGGPKPKMTDGHDHGPGLHRAWSHHDGHPAHRHDMATGRTEWARP